MQLPTQTQFVDDCLAKYRWEPIPSDQTWEAAHYPLPQCSGEGDTVLLWSADHTMQGLLQSVELNHKCFYHSANSKDLYNLETYYSEYLELFKQLKSQFASRQGKKGGRKAAVINQANGTSIFAPGMQSAGGKKAAVTNKANGTGFYDPKIQSAGAKTQHSQRYKCLVTGYISTPCGLSNYQKKRGIDTKLRVKIE